jgi:hypothetical protein
MIGKPERLYPVAASGSLLDDYPGMDQFTSYPSTRSNLLESMASLLPFMAVIAIPLFVLPHIADLSRGFPGLCLMLLLLGIGSWLYVVISRYMSFRVMIRHKARDVKELRAPEKDEQYVGIAYCDDEWSFRGDTSWDRGWFLVNGGALKFTGLGSDFRLPSSRIEHVRLAARQLWPFTSLPRVYVDWLDEEGITNTFSLEIRDAPGKKEAASRTEALESSVRRLLDDTSYSEAEASRAKWPFKSSSLVFSGVKLTIKDRLVALVVSLVPWVTLSYLDKSLQYGNHWLWIGFGPLLCLSVYRYVLNTRIPFRKKQLESSTSLKG